MAYDWKANEKQTVDARPKAEVDAAANAEAARVPKGPVAPVTHESDTYSVAGRDAYRGSPRDARFPQDSRDSRDGRDGRDARFANEDAYPAFPSSRVAVNMFETDIAELKKQLAAGRVVTASDLDFIFTTVKILVERLARKRD